MFGKILSKRARKRGSTILVYTVLAPNSFPQVKNPMISKSTFKIMVIAERGRGTKLDKIIPRPEILLTEAWLGKRKKYTAPATMAIAAVRISVSLISSVIWLFEWFMTHLFRDIFGYGSAMVER